MAKIDTMEIIKREIQDSILVKMDLLNSPELKKVEKAAELIINAYKKGCKLVLCGNGGSAADSQHIAAEMVGRFRMERKALAAIALNTNTSTITSLGNDYDFAITFERQVDAFVNKGDIVIGISTSGNAVNVSKAIYKAKKKGALTIGFAGKTGGKLAKAADICIKVPSEVTARIQEAHITLAHIICGMVENGLFKKK